MARDPIAVVEAAYRELATGDERAWLRGVLEAAAPLLERGKGIFAHTYTLPEEGDGVRIEAVVKRGLPRSFAKDLRQLAVTMPAADVEKMLLRKPVSTMSGVVGRAPDVSFTRQIARELAINDALGIVAQEPDGPSMVLCVPLVSVTRVDRATYARWSRVAVHLAAGLRLRRHFQAFGTAVSLDHVDAVLEPTGKLAHAQGDATSPRARVLLREAAVAIDRARGALRRKHPDDALETWRGLVDGRWSLVESFERDGRRYLVARRNTPDTRRAGGLDPIERMVAGYAALGHSNKLIAYETGLSQSSVSRCLARAAAKLGLASRVALVAAIGGGRKK